MEIKSKVKDGYLVMMFPVRDIPDEDIQYLKEDLEYSYRITYSLIKARRVLK